MYDCGFLEFIVLLNVYIKEKDLCARGKFLNDRKTVLKCLKPYLEKMPFDTQKAFTVAWKPKANRFCKKKVAVKT